MIYTSKNYSSLASQKALILGLIILLCGIKVNAQWAINHSGSGGSATLCGGETMQVRFTSFVSTYFTTGLPPANCAQMPSSISHTWYTAETGGSIVSSSIVDPLCNSSENWNTQFITAINASGSGTYWVQPYVNGSATGSRRSVTVNITQLPSSNAGISSNRVPSEPSCPGDLILTATGGSVINWYKDGLAIPVTTQTYAPQVNGRYKVKVNLSSSQCTGNPFSPELEVSGIGSSVTISPSMIKQTQRCGVTEVMLLQDPLFNVYWQPTNSLTSMEMNYVPGSNNSIRDVLEITEPTTLHLRAYDDGCWGASIFSFAVDVIPRPDISTLNLKTSVCQSDYVRVQAVVPSNHTFRWVNSKNKTLSTAVEFTTPLEKSTTIYLEATETATQCKAIKSVDLIVIDETHLPPIPVVRRVSDTQHELSYDPPVQGYTYYWQYLSDSKNITISTPTWTVTGPGFFYLRAKNQASGCWTNSSGIELYDLRPHTATLGSLNRIKTTVYAVGSNANMDDPMDVQVEWKYFDGFGRHIQTVLKQASPSLLDIVTPIEYNTEGNQVRDYLPYQAGTGNGLARTSPYSEQAAFYNQVIPGISSSKYPFSFTAIERSTRKRIEKEAAPGEDWAGVAGTSEEHTVRNETLTNSENEVIIWKLADQDDLDLSVITASGYYPPDQLFKNVTYDEHGKETIEFVDKDDKPICQKVQYGESNGQKQYAETYYLYDDFDNLLYVMPPELTKKLKENPTIEP